MLIMAALAIAACTGVLVPLCVRSCARAARWLQCRYDVTASQKLADLFVFMEPRQLSRACATALLAVLAVGVATGLPSWLTLVFSLAVLALPVWSLRRLRAARWRRLTGQLPDAMMLLASGLRSGQGLIQAIGHLAEHQRPPIAQEFQLLARKQRLGLPLDRALNELRDRVPTADFALFATAVRVAREMGGNLAETLERLADSLRRRLAMEEKIRSLTAQGRLQGWIVGLLPLLLLLVLTAMEPSVMREMFVRPVGWCALAIIAVLELAGALAIRRIVRIDV